VKFVEGGEIAISEARYEFFRLLGEEFRFEALAAERIRLLVDTEMRI
jgi:hypothetical protein